MKLVSVIIAVYNREGFIEQCLHSLLNQILERDYEVIVVDDGSTDNTRQVLVRFINPKLIFIYNESNCGPAYSRNRGIKQSCGKYIVFLDSDCMADECWIEEIIKPFDLEQLIMITSGRSIDPPSGTYWEMVNEGSNFIASRDGYVQESHTCNMAVRGSYIRENLFDERLSFSEDLDLCLGCLRKNFKIYYTSKATLVHFHRSAFTSTLRSYFRWGIYNTFVRLKWGSPPFLNYGTYVLLAGLIFLLFGVIGQQNIFSDISCVMFVLWLALVFYVRFQWVGFTRHISSYPGRVVMALANCTGNVLGVIFFVFRKFRHGHR